MIVALCGGVGGSKLALGLYRVAPAGSLTVIVNTADDLQFCGLHVSPDLDTVMYTLAGLSRPDVGWGIEGDSFQALDMLQRYGAPTWFAVGDRDLATDVYRTHALRSGAALSSVTSEMARSLDVRAHIIPMTDDPVETRLRVAGEWIEFQEYFVHRRHTVPVDAIRYDGIEKAAPAEGVVDILTDAEAVVIVNSNPVLSILPALSMPALRTALRNSRAPRVAVSPIVGHDAVSGPAGELMTLVGKPASCIGVADLYRDVIDGLVIDHVDVDARAAIEDLGVQVLVTNTIMQSIEDRERLADETLRFAQELQ